MTQKTLTWKFLTLLKPLMKTDNFSCFWGYVFIEICVKFGSLYIQPLAVKNSELIAKLICCVVASVDEA